MSTSPLSIPEDDSDDDVFYGSALSGAEFQTLVQETSRARFGSPEAPETPRPDRQTDILLPSSGPIRSSPIVGSRAEKTAQRRAKAMRGLKAANEGKRQAAEEEARLQHQVDLQDLVEYMHDLGLSIWDFMEYIFNPKNGRGDLRYNEFFAGHGNASQILDWWTASTNRSKTARHEVKEWVKGHAVKIIAQEARQVTKSKMLKSAGKTINADFVQAFSFSSIHESLSSESERLAPFAMRLFTAFSTSQRAKDHGERRKERTKMVVTNAALTCLGEFSHSNNLSKKMVGLYLYATGAQRQTITVLSTLGLSESYTNLVTKKKVKRKKKKDASNTTAAPDRENESADVSYHLGTLHQLSESMRSEAREIAASGLFEVVYDNININFRNAEQVIGRHDTQENGTCATLIPLFDAKIEDLNLETFRTAFLQAPILKLDDILHSKPDRQSFKNNLIHTILRIIVAHGGPGFQKFQKDLTKNEPVTDEKIPVHTSALHPLPTWNIDESSIIGNAEVDEAIVQELRLDTVPEAEHRVRLLGGDQLSIARLRALEFIRAGQEEGRSSFFWGGWIPGLFHAKIADTHGTLLTHFGKADTGAQNPGSLWFHNTRLDRLPITITSLPTFRTCRDLVFVSLYARVLHCLLLVSKCNSLDEYALKVNDWNILVDHATEIFTRYANAFTVEDLRDQRKDSLFGKKPTDLPTKGDMVYENASLFLRDALISREFSDAIKAGDSGRVILVLKAWALSYRGNGRTKYGYEMLHLIHHLTNVWHKALRDIIVKNWLLNPSGLPNRSVELDLVQEHLNFWNKIAYKARGPNASFDWLAIISPCIDVLRKLAQNFHDVLGADQGTRHAPPNLTEDINTLMTSLDEYSVYRVQDGRVLAEDELVNDVMSAGLRSLLDIEKGPLAEYNTAFQRLQRRRMMKPVSTTIPEQFPNNVESHPAHSVESSTQPPMAPISNVSLNNPTENVIEDSSVHEATDEPDEDEEDEVPTEVERILDDLERGIVEPTLLRLTVEDVALDMDEVEIEVDEDGEDSSESEDEELEEGEEEEEEDGDDDLPQY